MLERNLVFFRFLCLTTNQLQPLWVIWSPTSDQITHNPPLCCSQLLLFTLRSSPLECCNFALLQVSVIKAANPLLLPLVLLFLSSVWFQTHFVSLADSLLLMVHYRRCQEAKEEQSEEAIRGETDAPQGSLLSSCLISSPAFTPPETFITPHSFSHLSPPPPPLTWSCHPSG